jgi:hypothetical protein
MSIRLHGALVALCFLLSLSASRLYAEWSPLEERALFETATKVLLGQVIHYGGEEAAPRSRPTRPYRYQAIWVKETQLYKGPPHPKRFDYEVVLLPIRLKRFGPEHMLTGLVNRSSLPPDAEVLFYLKPDQAGAWTLVGGRQGMILHPGTARRANLHRWSKEATKKK